MRKNGLIIFLAAIAGAMAVAAGAFGAHAASGTAVRWLQTGAQYQMVHAVAALAAVSLQRGRIAAILFLVGGFIFAGSLYAMAFGAPRTLGAVAPIGGATLIAGWLALIFTKR